LFNISLELAKQAIKTTPKEWLVTYVLQKGKGYKEQ
jgi:hypothetical protein